MDPRLFEKRSVEELADAWEEDVPESFEAECHDTIPCPPPFQPEVTDDDFAF